MEAADIAEFDTERIRMLLAELGERLDRKDQAADLFIVGGGAMIIAYGRPGLTQDIDKMFQPTDAVREEIAAMASAHSLRADWLNDGVKGFLPATDPDAKVYLEVPGLPVMLASPRYLFSLKAVSARPGRDRLDLELLWPLCGFRDVDEAIDHVEAHMPKAMLTSKTSFLLRELFG